MRVGIVIVASVVAAGCNRGDATETNVGPDCILVSGMRVSPASMTLHRGDSAQFTVSAVSGCDSNNPPVQLVVAAWASSDSRIATVDAGNGSVRALDTGLVTVTAASKQDPNVKSAGVLRIIP